jgi:hypothetical protein
LLRFVQKSDLTSPRLSTGHLVRCDCG